MGPRPADQSGPRPGPDAGAQSNDRNAAGPADHGSGSGANYDGAGTDCTDPGANPRTGAKFNAKHVAPHMGDRADPIHGQCSHYARADADMDAHTAHRPHEWYGDGNDYPAVVDDQPESVVRQCTDYPGPDHAP